MKIKTPTTIPDFTVLEMFQDAMLEYLPMIFLITGQVQRLTKALYLIFNCGFELLVEAGF